MTLVTVDAPTRPTRTTVPGPAGRLPAGPVAGPSRPSRSLPGPAGRARRPLPVGTEARGFALYVGVDAADGETARRLRAIVDELRARLDEIAPDSEAYASVVLAPVGTVGRSVDVVRRTLADPAVLEGRGLASPLPDVPSCGLVVDLSRRRVLVDGEPAPLTYLEQCLLDHLVGSEGRTVPRTEIVEALWAERDDVVPNERTVDVHVRRLRSKLGRFEDVIRTVRGVGYRFDQHADVTVVA